MSNKLLLLEDEINVGSTLEEQLKKEGFDVFWAQTVAEAEEEIDRRDYALALLDIGLPDGTGFDVARFIRAKCASTAMIFLTAQGDPDYRIQGLELGAEDYIVKPFHLRELILRIRNGMRRASYLLDDDVKEPYALGEGLIYFSRFEVEKQGQTHPLTHKEAALLKLLVQKRGQVVSRDEILNRIWSEEEFPSTRTIDNFIVKLRKLLESDPETPKLIRSVRGVGYQLENTEKKE